MRPPPPPPSRASDSRYDLRPPRQHFLCFCWTGLGPPARGHKAASRDCFSPALQRPRWAACVEIAAAWARPVPVSPAVRASVRASEVEEAWSWCLRHFSAPQARWVRLRGGGLALLFCWLVSQLVCLSVCLACMLSRLGRTSALTLSS